MDGLLIIDKPAGLTSHDVVARVRRILHERRVGHTGTLDPFATGVLVVLVGRATRLAQFLSGAEKEYQAVIRRRRAVSVQAALLRERSVVAQVERARRLPRECLGRSRSREGARVQARGSREPGAVQWRRVRARSRSRESCCHGAWPAERRCRSHMVFHHGPVAKERARRPQGQLHEREVVGATRWVARSRLESASARFLARMPRRPKAIMERIR